MNLDEVKYESASYLIHRYQKLMEEMDRLDPVLDDDMRHATAKEMVRIKRRLEQMR